MACSGACSRSLLPDWTFGSKCRIAGCLRITVPYMYVHVHVHANVNRRVTHLCGRERETPTAPAIIVMQWTKEGHVVDLRLVIAACCVDHRYGIAHIKASSFIGTCRTGQPRVQDSLHDISPGITLLPASQKSRCPRAHVPDGRSCTIRRS